MVRIDLPALFERLSPACRHALEEASSLCVGHRGAEVTVPHLLFKLLENPLGDVRILLKHGGIEVDAARQALSSAFAGRDDGNDQYPSFSPLLIELLQEAWLLGSLESKQESIRGGGLLLAVLLNPGRYLPLAAIRLFDDINRETLRKQFNQLLANSSETPQVAVAARASVSTLRAAVHEVERDRARIAARSMMAGKISDGLANRWSNRAIGLTALAAAVQAVSDFNQADKESGFTQDLKKFGAYLQIVSSSLGGLHLLGKTHIPMEIIKNLAEGGLGRTAISAGMTGAVETAVSRAIGGTFSGISRTATLGAGPVGWILFGIQSFYLVLNNWHDRLVEEQRYTDWIACSIWGDGQRDTVMLGLLGGDSLNPYGDDETQELRDYDRLWQKPRVSSDIDWLKALAENGPAHGEIEAGAPSRSIGFESRFTPLEVRTISVLFPGWKPQVSWYEIEHYHDLDRMGIEKTLNGRDRVEAYKGYGILTFDSANMIGNTRVKYYPNHAASPDFYLTNGNENDRTR